MCWMIHEERNGVAPKDLRTWDVACPVAIDPRVASLLESIGDCDLMLYCGKVVYGVSTAEL